ncbi:M3 family oligoendopeptidase [Bacillus sp. FJAT-22090]|uniref:M3 family oligoendopeptidase n=1 Tax=Bacillus sp. FJAT-22090 TaxID=1581038 RepID=UPI00119CF8A0|nr:M3 family oligoendopeptidase [Bacillus sp. FJAT-22090]
MIEQTYPIVWDLDRFFEGGSSSQALRTHLDNVKSKLVEFEQDLNNFTTPSSVQNVEEIEKAINNLKDIAVNLSEGGAVIGCLLAQDTTDKQATLLEGEVGSLYARLSSVLLVIQQVLSRTEETVWQELLQTEELSSFSFVLNEWRKEAKQMLTEKEEEMITTLGVDGYHAWGQLYDLLVGDIHIKLTIDGVEKVLSVGQANNLSSHENANIRKESFEALEAAWTEKEEFFAKTLNHLAGFRLAVYEKRGWESVLQEPLQINRMKQETLDAMWGAIAKNKAPFAEYLNKKSAMLGEQRMHWYDLDAPVNASTEKMDYQQGASFILKHFKEFGPKLEAFSRNAFEKGWIEAEDRPNKRPGGFCTGMPVSEESRIFMTYSGSMSNVSTLAHELGHAFHSYALRPVHWMNRQYAMGVAETASTFAEMIVADAAVKEAKNDEEKIALLEDKIQRSVAFFMNIHARFLFETRFYEERKNGIVSASKLNELMETAQIEAYGGALETTHPHFWASKLHFYITDVPFYNFPYTFGYLFSLSIYAKAIKEGANFEEKYIALLQDTAVMTVEDLAMKHLGEDITKEAFWIKGINLCIQDVNDFIQLTNAKG